jgi:putative DNA primase/helicase
MNFNDYSFKKNDYDILSKVDYITQAYTFATLRDSEEIYYYDNSKGIFVNHGDKLIKSEIGSMHREITTSKMNEIINHVKWETYRDREEFDQDIRWLACKNCMINLKTGETKPHSPDFMATVQIPVYYDEKCLSCPKIMKFLYEVIHNKKDIDTILDFLAYCLWRETKFHKMLVLLGEGRNGKGTLCNIIRRFFGFINVSSESIDQLISRNFSPSQLYKKLINIDPDISKKKLQNTGILKKLTGNDQISAEEKYKPQFNFINYAKIILVANELPEIDEDTIAIFSRLIVIDFSKTYLDNANPDLIKELTTREELSGLLSVLLKRLPGVLKHGIYYTKSIEEISSKYYLRRNSVKVFAEEYLESSENNIRKDILYKKYKDFCYKNKIAPKSEYTFSQQLTLIGLSYSQIRKGKDRYYYWMNVKIKYKSY